MTFAAITGWGKCMPPAVLTNDDLATFLETDDAWITQRTGIRERRITHVLGTELAHVAALRALACAGLAPTDIDLIVFGSCSAEEAVPNTASGLQYRLGATDAAAMDVNTACTSFLYGLSAASGMIRAGTVRRALVVGVETISPFMDWDNRNVAVLFGDGCAAVVLEASDREEGVLADKLGCYADARQILRVRGPRHDLRQPRRHLRRHAVGLRRPGDLQARGARDERIGRRGARARRQDAGRHRPRGPAPGQPADHRVRGQARGHRRWTACSSPCTSTATCRRRPCRSRWSTRVEEGRVRPNALLLTPAFGAGLTWCSHVIRWGERVTPRDGTDVDLPPCERTALQMVNALRAAKVAKERSRAGLNSPVFPEPPAAGAAP